MKYCYWRLYQQPQGSICPYQVYRHKTVTHVLYQPDLKPICYLLIFKTMTIAFFFIFLVVVPFHGFRDILVISTFIELLQSTVSLQDFQEAEPDVLVHSASTIIEHLTEYGMKCDTALKALCRKKRGLHVEVWPAIIYQCCIYS